jgi:cobalt/nickel transport protein
MKNRDIFIAIVLVLIVAAFSFLACSSPDGLERVASDRNFMFKATSIIRSPLPDYLFPGLHNEKISTALAGISGVLLIYFLGIGLAKLLSQNKK